MKSSSIFIEEGGTVLGVLIMVLMFMISVKLIAGVS